MKQFHKIAKIYKKNIKNGVQMKQSKKIMILVLVLIIGSMSLFAKEKPYILISNSQGDLLQKVTETKTILENNGFEIVGEYTPFEGRHVVAFTNDNILTDCAKTDFGAYGAALRIAFTEFENKIQVAYTNPIYWANAYRMSLDAEQLNRQLEKCFGKGEAFGSEDGLELKKLRKYHYMVGMPYFDDPYELAKYNSYEEGIEVVESGLKAQKGGVSKVYRIDIPNKKETVFGVALTQKSGSDKSILDKIDNSNLKHTPYLCYEIVVSENKAYALHGRFRIAVSFPDLTMGSFSKIMSAPNDIKEALEEVAKK